MILVCIQFALSAWSLSLREELPGAAKYQMDTSYSEFKHTINDPTHIWHKMQYELQCCGIYELSDYFRTDGIHVGVPWSCCTTPTEPEVWKYHIEKIFHPKIIAVLSTFYQHLFIYINLSILFFSMPHVNHSTSEDVSTFYQIPSAIDFFMCR